MSRRLRFRFVAVVAAVLLLIFALAVWRVPKARQGARVAWFKATGSLPDVSWGDLYRMGKPGKKRFNLPQLAEEPNPYAAIRNPYFEPEDLSAAKVLFRANCSTCHGSDGIGGHGGPPLQHRQMTQGDSDWALFRTVSFGIRGTAMPSSTLSWIQKWQLVAYVRSLSLLSTNAGETTVSAQPVSYEDIRGAEKSDGWLTYSGSYDSSRFSPHKEITPENASRLRLIWMRQYDVAEPSIETSPLVVGRYMFVTLPPSRVEALDARSGDLIWAYDRELPDHLSLCCGYVNRGLAVLGNTLFLGTLDAHLIALDISTGSVSWDVEITNHKTGYSITGAPLVVKNLVITGVAGGEFGIRGFVQARDAATGKEVWKFDVIPQPGQPGSHTWDGDSWKIGGGPTWLTGSFDPDTNLIYWPTGNPSPNFEGGVRVGDNLYTNSMVALDADKGTLRWYFQFSPHDVFDWDATEIPVLLKKNVKGTTRSYLAQANRNGFFYLLDAKTGHFELGKPYAKVNWAERLDSNGRPVAADGVVPTEKGTSVFPGVGGATNWESPSYSMATGMFYVPALEWGGVFYKGHSEHHEGEMFLGGSFQFFPNETSQAAVRALDPLTGDMRWEYRNPATNVGGLLSTGGGVLFGSQDQAFFALDANNGRELWRVATGGRTVAAPITFLSKGKQMVTIAAGHDILTFALPEEQKTTNRKIAH